MSNPSIELDATILPTPLIDQIAIKEQSSKQLYQKPAYEDTILNPKDEVNTIQNSTSSLLNDVKSSTQTQGQTQGQTQLQTQVAQSQIQTQELSQTNVQIRFQTQDQIILEQSKSLNRAAIFGTKSKSFTQTQHRYITQNKLGEGNFGVVWKAVDSDIGREIAIKTFKVDAAKGRQMFEDEIKVAGYLDHPGIPPIHDVGIDENGKYYFVMKYINGVPLSTIIEKLKAGDQEMHDRFPFERRADLMIQLLRILKAAHQEGVIHRDIKPDNLMIGPSDEVMLVDWGIALNLNENNGENILCGTPLYMSPEQAQMKALTRQSDLYSVGAVFYELISLSKPIPSAPSIVEMLQKNHSLHT